MKNFLVVFYLKRAKTIIEDDYLGNFSTKNLRDELPRRNENGIQQEGKQR